MNLIKQNIETLFLDALKNLKYDIPENLNLITVSNRLDLSDYQSNIALVLAKTLKKNPNIIAREILNNIDTDDIIITIDGPGFINIKISNAFLSSVITKIQLTPPAIKKSLKIVIDYGGPNVAKSLHVGHLRSSIIGEALKNLARFIGHKVVGDIHLGDWGLPMGMIIASIKEQGIALPLSVKDLNIIYPVASKRSKEDDAFMKKAQEETKKLQNKDSENIGIWKNFCNTSITDIKEILNILNVEFDLWNGESSANDDVNLIIDKLKKEKLTSFSDGAEVIFLKDYPLHNNEPPPFIVLKSNGAIMYGMTDIGTLYDRIERQKVDLVLYVVDSRQELHFHQVFSVASIIGLKKNVGLEFLGFGTILGTDAKPLKTRSGENVSLRELLDTSINFAYEKINENEKTKDLTILEKKDIAKDVAIAAIKFADLINPRQNDYIFNMEKFINFEGKTGSYILYTAVRIKSILKELNENQNIDNSIVQINNDSVRKLSLKIIDFSDIIERSFSMRAVNIFVQYIYELAVIFNDFYHNCKIKTEENEQIKKSYLKLCKISLAIFNIFAKIVKINIPERM